MRSDQVKKGVERSPNRALLYATGLTEQGIKKPFIGVASAFTDLVPGHVDMRQLERFIERGVEAGGGLASADTHLLRRKGMRAVQADG